MTEVGILLYQQLRSAPTFRYALVGLEVDEFRTYHELCEEPNCLFPGIVLNQSVWDKFSMASDRTFSKASTI
jgi:hypothetical protein